MSLIRHAFVMSRVHGMFAGFIQAQEYEQLLQSQTLQEFEKVLRSVFNIPGTGLQVVGNDSIHLEDRLVGRFLQFIRTIAKFLSKEEKDFLTALTTQYEVFNIKAFLRGRILGIPTEKIRAEMIPLAACATLDWEELLAEEETVEVLRMLRSHPLGERIEKAYLHKYLVDHSTYQMDSRIDLEYLIWLFDKAQRFAGPEAALLKRMIGQRMDAINVSWILRLRENFQRTPEEIMVELVPRGYHLDLEDLKELAFAEDRRLFLNMLRAYPWRKYIPADTLDIPAVETGMERYVKEESYQVFRWYPLRFAGIAAFVLLAQALVADLIKIMEATEYSLARESVAPTLFYLNR